MDFAYQPFRLQQNMTEFSRKLLYVGTTYYDRFLVFEHLDNPISKIWGMEVPKVELYFSEEKLIAISALLKEKISNYPNVIELIEKQTCLQTKIFGTEVLFSSIGNTVYYWKNKVSKLALLSSLDSDQLVLNYSLNDFNLFCWEE